MLIKDMFTDNMIDSERYETEKKAAQKILTMLGGVSYSTAISVLKRAISFLPEKSLVQLDAPSNSTAEGNQAESELTEVVVIPDRSHEKQNIRL